MKMHLRSLEKLIKLYSNRLNPVSLEAEQTYSVDIVSQRTSIIFVTGSLMATIIFVYEYKCG